MSLRIQNNVEAFNAHRNLTGVSAKVTESMERLSSGYRINRAADDAAGLAISEKMRAQVRGLAQAQRNSLDGISLVQTAEGAFETQHAILQRVRELAVQRQNGTLTTTDQAKIDSEVTALTAELERIKTQTKFNGLNLLDGTSNGGSFTFQVGANSSESISATISSVSFGTINASQITSIDAALDSVSDNRAKLGAVQN